MVVALHLCMRMHGSGRDAARGRSGTAWGFKTAERVTATLYCDRCHMHPRPPLSPFKHPKTSVTGTAAYALLSSNRDARCNGVKPECYRSLCVQSQKDCPLAAGKPLTLARCPANLGSQFTECWATKDLSFLCAGVGRPSTSVNMDALCAPDNKSKSNDTSLFDLNPTGAGLSTSPQGTIIGPNGVELFPMNRNGAAQRGVSGAAAVLSAAAGVFMLL